MNTTSCRRLWFPSLVGPIATAIGHAASLLVFAGLAGAMQRNKRIHTTGARPNPAPTEGAPASAFDVALDDVSDGFANAEKLIDVARPTRPQAQPNAATPDFPTLPSDAVAGPSAWPVEITIILPCLNEEEAIGGCIDAIHLIIASRRLNAEILVVDNASTDRSAEIARMHGARVVSQPARGYGNAYLKGFAEAHGHYLVMVDADNTYDFNEIEAFIAALRQGYDLVIGNRFSGRLAKGAMTWSHRYIGNPLLSGLLNLLFHTGIRDAHCGMRAFTKEAVTRMHLRTGGMEFASEMVINAAKAGLRITEQPIAYYPRVGESKLDTVRDGWRHLRFMLLYSPTHLFLIPGAFLMIVGLTVLSVLLPGPVLFFGKRWDFHTMTLASVITLIGLQIVLLGLSARFFSLTEHLDGEQDRLLRWLNRSFTLERGLQIGGVLFGIGFVIDGWILIKWVLESLGQLNEIRPAIFATTLLAMGTQVIFGSFFLSFLQFSKSIHESIHSLSNRGAE
jgi:glycosyltransferase involved in cell wall biosynthesis